MAIGKGEGDYEREKEGFEELTQSSIATPCHPREGEDPECC